MPPHLKGELCALLAALVWALALMLFKKGGETVAPLPLNLFKNTVGLILLVVTLPFAGASLPEDGAQPNDLTILVISGILGIAVADTLFFAGLNRMGVGLIAIVDCSYTPLVVLCSWLLIGETLTAQQGLGVAMILTAILIAFGSPRAVGHTRSELAIGITLTIASLALMAFGIVMAKPVLERWPLISATTVRLLAGSAALAAIGALLPGRRQLWQVFKPAAVWQKIVPASVLGTYVSLVLWVAGFKYAQASIAAALNQMSTIFALILATLVLRERLTPQKIIAVCLAVAGVLTVTLAKVA